MSEKKIKRKIGIYGGTFDPIHKGHMVAAQTAADVLGLDLLLLIPDSTPPHKFLSESSATSEQRLEMTEIAADRLKCKCKVKVLDLELKREGKSYTADTIRELHKMYPKEELWLLMGTDMFLTLHQWREPDVIMRYANICAFGRNKSDGDALFEPQRKYLKDNFGAHTKCISLPELVVVSSTQLREQLGKGLIPPELDESIYGYILRNGLYGTKTDLTSISDEQLRACSYSMIKSKRIPHVRGCEQEAVKLALHWGADPEKAAKAAILHDCTKYWPLERHLELCRTYGMELDELESISEKLLHSKTGSLIARHVYGMPDDICNAIYYHTTGHADMTLLEKILYIADYMEPTRNFDGVERLRELVYRNLDDAIILGLEMTIEEMKGYNNPVHYKTQEALDFLREEKQNG